MIGDVQQQEQQLLPRREPPRPPVMNHALSNALFNSTLYPISEHTSHAHAQ